MIKLKLEGKNYNIPNNLDELSIKDYQYIKGINTENKFKYFMLLLEYFGIKQHLSKGINSKQVLIIIDAINLMFNQTNVKLKTDIIVDDIHYQFEKNLNQLRFDQFVDLTQLTENEKTITDNIHLIAAILYRPLIDVKKEKFKLKHLYSKRKAIYVAEKYDSTKVIERGEIFRNKLNMEVVYGLLFFFSRLKLIHLNNTLESLLKEEQKKMKKEI